MNTTLQRMTRTRVTSVLAVLAASASLCSVALADGGHGNSRGGSSFSASRSGGGHNSSGGRSYGGERGGGSQSARSGGAPRGNASSGRNYGSSGNSSSSRSNSSGNRVWSGGSRSSGNVDSSGSYRAPSGNMRTAPRYDSNRATGGSRPGFNSGQYGVRIPDATRPGVSPGASVNARPGFNTTRPDFGVSRSDGRSEGYRRPGTGNSLNGRTDSNGGRDFNGRNNFSRGSSGNRDANERGDNRRPEFNGRNNFARGDSSRRGDYNGRGNFNGRGNYNGHRPGYYGSRHWNGGYWNGRYWPRSYYRSNFISFWPLLPATYATYWYGGVSYYYVDDLYYTWSPARYGYVVTDPPPVVSSSATTEVEAADDSAYADSADASGSASVYVYPRNGQNEEQTANDRYECHQWAVSQTGFDPTTDTADSQGTDGPADYRRALIACLDGRGYSAN